MTISLPDLADQAAEYREKMIETVIDQDDDAMEAYLDGKEPDEATLEGLHSQGHHLWRIRTSSLWFGVQEQGRAAVA